MFKTLSYSDVGVLSNAVSLSYPIPQTSPAKYCQIQLYTMYCQIVKCIVNVLSILVSLKGLKKRIIEVDRSYQLK